MSRRLRGVTPEQCERAVAHLFDVRQVVLPDFYQKREGDDHARP